MKTSLLSIFLLPLISTSFASIGDSCGGNGLKGTCKEVKDCTSGFTLTGACPKDGASIKCCVRKECTKVQKAPLESLGGNCYDRKYNSCSSGHFERNLCPGDNSVQCCIKDPSKPSPPPSAYCPNIKTIPVGDGGWDHILYSRQETKKVGNIYKNVGKVYDICDAIASTVGKGIGGLPCKLAKVAVDHIADHAEECDKKNQCLKLKAYSVPYCVGANDGCCSQSIGTWVDP